MLPAITYEVGVKEYIYELKESNTKEEKRKIEKQLLIAGSINLICVPLGCIFSGSLAQPLGRRRAMQFVNIPMLAAWLCFHFSTDVTHLYAGLCLAGLSGGLLEVRSLSHSLSAGYKWPWA